MIYRIRVLLPFTDIITGKLTTIGEIIQVKPEARARDIIYRGLGELVSARHETREGKRILVHQRLLYQIGGIETANRQLAQAFPEADITFLFERADPTQLLEIAKYASVILDDGVKRYETDVLLLSNHDSGPAILKRVKAEKIYQIIHADWRDMRRLLPGVVWKPDPRVDRVISVSETARDGLKAAFGVDSVVCRNILNPLDPERRRRVFLVLSRASREKGIERLLDLINRFSAAGKDFVFLLCSTIDQLPTSEQKRIKDNPRILVVPPSPYSQELLRSADYLVQLSSSETYCYSVREALQAKVPVIVSDIPEFRKLVENGRNGYILKDDLSDLDVEKIFNEIPAVLPYAEEIDPTWRKVLNGEL